MKSTILNCTSARGSKQNNHNEYWGNSHACAHHVQLMDQLVHLNQVDPEEVSLGVADGQMVGGGAVGQTGGLVLHPLFVDNAAPAHQRQALHMPHMRPVFLSRNTIITKKVRNKTHN